MWPARSTFLLREPSSLWFYTRISDGSWVIAASNGFGMLHAMAAKLKSALQSSNPNLAADIDLTGQRGWNLSLLAALAAAADIENAPAVLKTALAQDQQRLSVSKGTAFFATWYVFFSGGPGSSDNAPFDSFVFPDDLVLPRFDSAMTWAGESPEQDTQGVVLGTRPAERLRQRSLRETFNPLIPATALALGVGATLYVGAKGGMR